MNIRNLLVGIVVAMSLAACETVPQGRIELTKDVLAAQKGRVGVAISAPEPGLYLPGAACLLCIGAAKIANSSLNEYATTLKADEMLAVRTEIVELMRKKGIDATAINGQLELDKLPDRTLATNMASKDYSSVGKGFDHLVVINVQQLGFVRTYSSYIPTSDPKATVGAFVFMVNLKTNAYEWWEHVQITRSAEGAWNEKPAFPGLTNAYFQAIEQAKDQIKSPFAE